MTETMKIIVPEGVKLLIYPTSELENESVGELVILQNLEGSIRWLPQ